MKKKLLIAIGFFISSSIQSNPDSTLTNTQYFVVDSIRISGNEITEEFIILRELTFQTGDTITLSDLKYNRERIFSLRLFTHVEIIPMEENQKTIISINVEEGWYLYPIPFIRKKERNSNQLSYGISFNYKNFRGRNENLRAIISLGYDPYFSVYYYNPAFSYKGNLGFSFGLTYLNYGNKSVRAKELFKGDFKTKFYSISLAAEKRINQFNELFISTSFDYIESPKNSIGNMTASGKPIDRTLSFGIGYMYDSRDLKQFSNEGLFTSILMRHKGFGINGINYNILNFDFREYRNIVEELSARWRFAFRHTFGKQIPFYDNSFLGYDEYVRGQSENIREGNNYLLSSIEFSYPIIKEFDFSIKLPLIPRQLTSARIGIFVTAFTDAGNTFDNHQRFRFKDFYYGYGFGLTILVLPYSAFRIEYAINNYKKGEILFGSGFSF